MNYKIILSLIIALLVFPSAYSFVLEVNEGELVKLKVESIDADNDTVAYYFSEPLDENGEWQTDFLDAGNYTIWVTADDGIEQVTREVTILIRNVNQPPEIQASDIEINESETASIETEVSDIDNDDITLTYSSPFDDDGEWETDFADAGEYEITISAYDGEFTVEEKIYVTVYDINQLPEVTVSPSDSLSINETDSVTLKIEASDFDNDVLAYSWYQNGQVISEEPEFHFITDFESSGTYEFIAVVYDKETKVEVPVQVSIGNVNRVPVLNISEVIVIKETDIIEFDLPSEDSDGQTLTYTISDPVGSDQAWETSYDDAGEYDIEIIADDSETTVNQTIKLIVQDVDRAPEVSNIQTSIQEGEELSIELIAEDPDGDEINYTIIEGPEGMIADGSTLSWTPDYDFIEIGYGFFSKLFFKIGLSNELNHNDSRLVEVVVNAKGRTESSTININVTVWNTNRAPVIEPLEDIDIEETEIIQLVPVIEDPDGDPIKISFSGFMASDTYHTSYDDSGDYTVIVSAYDGNLLSEYNVSVEIENKNREPKLITKEVVFVEDAKSKANLVVYDPDGDEIDIKEVSLPEGAEFKKDSITWKPDFEFVQHHDTGFFEGIKVGLVGHSENFYGTAVLDDGEVEVEREFVIVVEDVNRPPVLEEIPKLTVNENELLDIPINAVDPDGDVLKFKFKGLVDDNNQTIGFDDEGNREITIVVSDGEWKRSRRVPVTVLHTNRKPEFEIKDTEVKEGQILYHKLEADDPDKDELTYTIIDCPEGAAIEGNTLVYTPPFETVMHPNTSMEKTLLGSVFGGKLAFPLSCKVAASDTEFTVNASFTIEVIDVNRPPILINQSPVSEFTTYSGNLINFTVAAYDPDNDPLTFTWKTGMTEKYKAGSTHFRRVVNPGIKDMSVIVSDGEFEETTMWRYAVVAPAVAQTTEIEPTPIPATNVQPVMSFTIEG
jgi:hypothetical protein